MIIPLIVLPQLQIGLRQKLSTAVMFILGFIVIAFSITRLEESLNDLPSASAGNNFFLYTELEASVAVIICNLPTVRIFQRYLARRYRRKKQSGALGSESDSRARANGKTLSDAGINVTTSTHLSYMRPPKAAYSPVHYHDNGKSQEILLTELSKSDSDPTKEKHSLEHQVQSPT